MSLPKTYLCLAVALCQFWQPSDCRFELHSCGKPANKLARESAYTAGVLQAVIVASQQDVLIPRDRLDLQLSQNPSPALQLAGSTAMPGASLQLMSDPAAPERVFAVHPQGMLLAAAHSNVVAVNE